MSSVLLRALLFICGTALLHASQFCLKGDFDKQVTQFIHKVQLPKQELNKLSLALHDLQETLQTKWPGCTVSPYGSTVAGLSMTMSDFDCFVTLPNSTVIDTPGSLLKILYSAERIFNKHPELFQNTYVKSVGAVPLVNVIHLPSGRDCDVTFSGPIAIRDSKLISYYLSLDKRAYNLAMIVKYWSRIHRLKQIVYIPNFCITLLVIFYLQQVHILPPLALLQKDAESIMVEKWNTGYNEIAYNTTNKDSLYELLGGFFKYYGNFDFNKNLISIYVGHPIKKSDFKDLETVPEDYEEYKHNVKNNIVPPVNLAVTIIVLNPFDHQRNSARTVGRTGSVRFQYEFKYASKIYQTCSSDRFLTSILTPHANFTTKKDTKNWFSITKAERGNTYRCVDVI